MSYQHGVFSLFTFESTSSSLFEQILLRFLLLRRCLYCYLRFVFLQLKVSFGNFQTMNKEQRPFISKTPIDFQRLKLERLMANPDKPVIIPERPKEKKEFTVPEFVRNVMGSSAGAGSGEFHVYRHLRRKEYMRQKLLEEEAEKEKLDEEYRKKLEENKRKMEERTEKKRAKRLKKKTKQKKKHKGSSTVPVNTKKSIDESSSERKSSEDAHSEEKGDVERCIEISESRNESQNQNVDTKMTSDTEHMDSS